MSMRTVLASICLGTAVVAASGLVACLGGCAIVVGGWQEPAFKETRESWAPVAAQQAVTIESGNGAIVIGAMQEEGGPADQVKITAEIKATTEERLAMAEVRADRQSDGSLLIHVAWPDGKREPNEGARLEVLLPAGSVSALKATTSNGAIELTGLQAPEGGGAQLKSSNGAISVRGFAGDIRAETSNGAVTVHGATGDVDADSSNGRIEIVQAPGAGSVTAETSNGGITIDLASGFAGAIRGRTSNGRVTLPRGDDVTVVRAERREGKVRVGAAGDGGAMVEAKTSNGSIEVRR